LIPNGPAITSTAHHTPSRKDARTNRERILTAAREAFAASSSASLSAIARQAGVGIGTLYRHFPSREALIVELYRHDIQHLIDLAPALAAEVIHAATSDEEYYEPFVRAIAGLLDHGAADGSLKQGLDPEDVLLQLSVLWRIDPERGGEARAERILDLIIDGLQARPPGTH